MPKGAAGKPAENIDAGLLESNTVAVIIVDTAMRILQATPGWRRDRGLEGADILGRCLYDLVPSTLEWKGAYDRCLAGGELREERLRLVLPDGSRRWVNAEITPWRRADGEIGGLTVLTIDVTDLVLALRRVERSQEQLKLALEIGEMRMWALDHKRRQVEVAGPPVASRRLSYEEFGDVWSAMHPDDRGPAQEAWEQHLRTGAPYRMAFRSLNGEGHRWLYSAAEVIRDQRGRVVTTVGILRDIDKERRAEAELIAAKEAAEAANKTKNEFLANMSHEIRTPLNGVLGVAGALAKTGLDSRQAEMVGIIESSAKTLEALLSDVLDLARIESGRMDLRHEPFDLAATVEACAALFESSADSKGLRFVRDFAPEAAGHVMGDAHRIRQILSNLLGNAVKFTERGEIRFGVRQAGGRLVFEVADTGIGFDTEAAQRLFARFEQADGSITRKYGGTGLGLAISKSIAEAMGGELSAAAQPGAGAVFTLALPLERCEARACEPQAEAQPAASLDCVTVLLADDHATNRKVVELILGAAGVRLTAVENGAQAVEAARRDRFDLILMDMQMPEMDGLTAIRAIRAHEAANGLPAVPIYSLTGHAMPEHVEASEKAGADGHLTKPIGAEALLARVEEGLALGRARTVAPPASRRRKGPRP